MLKMIFNGVKIKNKKRFAIFLTLYILTFVSFCYLCTIEAIMSLKVQDIPGVVLLIPGMNYFVYHGSLAAILYGAVSFVEILFIAWQTNLKDQRLNRFVLFFLAINMVLVIIGLGASDGIVYVIILLFTIVLVLILPTVIVIKVKERNGTYDYSDIMTPEEYKEYKKRKGI